MYDPCHRWDPGPAPYAVAVIRRLALASLASTLLAVVVATPVSAHIHAEPHEAQAGSTATIGFTIEHGCDGSPTVAVEVLLPAGVTDVTPEPFDDWTVTTDTTDEGDVVIYDEGSLADGTAGTFEITMTLPPTPDTTIWFPMVQRCDEGELRWIEIPVEGEDEPDSPAPGVQLVGPVATTTTPAVTVPETTPDEPDPTTAPDTTDPSTASTSPSETTPDTAQSSVPTTTVADDDDSNVGTTVFIVSVLAVAVVGALAYVFARRGRRDDGDAPADGDS